MNSARKKTVTLFLTVLTTIAIAFSLTAGINSNFINSIRSEAVYVRTDGEAKKITVIPTDVNKISAELIGDALKKDVTPVDGEIVKNGAKIKIDDEIYTLIIKGDVVADGKITALDARGILRISARLENVDDITRNAADIDSDSRVTSAEARTVLRFVSRLTDKLLDFPQGLPDSSDSASTSGTSEITASDSNQKTTVREETTIKPVESTTESTTVKPIEATTETMTVKPTEPTTKGPVQTTEQPTKEEESSAADKENKKIVWVAIGDSKTDFNNNGVSRPDNYPYWIALRNPQLELINLGSAGGMITNERVKNPGDTKVIYPSMYTMATRIKEKPDIITVAGGFNDWNWCVSLGEFTTDISSYDTSPESYVANYGVKFPLKNTFYMGVYRLAEYLKTTYPDTPILWITPCPTARNNYGGENGYGVNQPLSAYVQAIKDVCEYFEIPVCDMSKETSVPYYTPEDLKNYWRSGDGIHPNGKSSEVYSYKIEEYMKKAYEDCGYKWDIN